ncbi:MAG: hypothetical protein PUH54_10665 [Oscillospiraceae bacterium]|nr:hypothetical protein [Oscillospiraceae bacterium]
MDSFAEQLVKREDTSSDKMKKYLIYGGGIFITIALVILAVLKMGSTVSIIMLLLAGGAGYLTYFLGTSTYVEYEYAFTNGELDIDKIIAKRKRVELLSADVRKFTAFGKYSEDIDDSDDLTTVISSDNIASHEYYADFECDKYGKTRLIFAPDEKILEYIMDFLPYSVKRNMQ